MAAPNLPKFRGIDQVTRLKRGDTSQVGRRDQSSCSRPKGIQPTRPGAKDASMARTDGGIGKAGRREPVQGDRAILVVCPTHRDHRELPRVSPPGVKYTTTPARASKT
jgi:hypothetical protein